MNFTVEQMPDGALVRVSDRRLDAAQAIRFKDRLREIVGRHGPRIVLDLGAVDFMDSSGLGAILAIRRGLPPGHRIELAALTPNVDRVIRLTRMDTIFTLHETPDAALQAGARPAGGET